MADTPFNARNGLVANALFTANSTQVSLGSNVIITPATITILTSTGNVVVNSTAVFLGNSSVNTTINSTSAALFIVNTAAQWLWTNNHTFNATTTFAANTTFQGTINEAAANTLAQTLTYAATTNWDASLGRIGTLTLTANTIMAAPTNLKVGTYILHIIQDATGSRVVTSWNAVFKWVQATAPVLSTVANRHDIISFICDGTNLYGSFLPDVR